MRLFSIAHISVGVEMMVYSEDGRDLRNKRKSLRSDIVGKCGTELRPPGV